MSCSTNSCCTRSVCCAPPTPCAPCVACRPPCPPRCPPRPTKTTVGFAPNNNRGFRDRGGPLRFTYQITKLGLPTALSTLSTLLPASLPTKSGRLLLPTSATMSTSTTEAGLRLYPETHSRYALPTAHASGLLSLPTNLQ